jgi:hypothetical protein
VLPVAPLEPPCCGCDGNGDSGPPPWLEAWPPPPEPGLDDWLPLDPCPELGLPPDDDGDGEEGGDDDGDEGLVGCGIEGDGIEVCAVQPARASAKAAGQSRL